MNPLEISNSEDFIDKEANARNRCIIHYSSSSLPSYVWWSSWDIWRQSLEKRLDWWEQDAEEEFSAIRNCQEIIEILEEAVEIKKRKSKTIYLCSKRVELPALIENIILSNLFRIKSTKYKI